MADRTIKIIEAAETEDLLTLEEAKIGLGMSASDSSQDATLNQLISIYSATVAEMCNRTFAQETVKETWREVNGRLFLSHWPIAEDGITSVSAGGIIVGSGAYELEEQSGKLSYITNPGGPYSTSWTVPVVVDYIGGYILPGEAPKPLKQATILLMQEAKMKMQQASAGGIRMISHKGSRIMFYDPNAALAKAAGAKSQAMQAAEALLRQYMRFEV